MLTTQYGNSLDHQTCKAAVAMGYSVVAHKRATTLIGVRPNIDLRAILMASPPGSVGFSASAQEWISGRGRATRKEDPDALINQAAGLSALAAFAAPSTAISAASIECIGDLQHLTFLDVTSNPSIDSRHVLSLQQKATRT